MDGSPIDQLVEERRRLTDAQRVGHLGSWEVDLESSAVTWSDMIFELYGLDRAGFDDDLATALDVIVPEDRAKVATALADCAESGVPMRVHYRVVRRSDGAMRSLDARGELLTGADGRSRLVGTAADVTEMVEQVRAEAESQATYAFQESILAATPDTMFVYDVSLQTSVWSNRPVAALFGRPDGGPDAARDDAPTDGMATWLSGDARSQFETAIASTRAAADGEVVRLDYAVDLPDGHVRWLSQRTTPLRRDPQGRVVQLSGALRDITDRRRTALALANSEERFRLAFWTAPIGMALIDPVERGRMIQVNPALCTLTGRPEVDLLDLRLQSLLHPDDGDVIARMLERLGEVADEPMYAETRLVTARGDIVWAQLGISFAPTSVASPGYAICLIADVTTRKDAEAALVHLGMHDPLTRLPNRTLLHDRLDHALAASARSGKHVGVIYIDLDGFKAVNDSGGHAAGDELLVQVAQRLVSVVRPGDTVGRIGGDEFGVVCEDVADLDSVRVAATRLLKILSEPFRLASGVHHISGSIGLSMSDGANRPEQLLAEADASMYRAKHAGKNRIAVAHVEDHARAARLARLGPELGVALTHDQLIMHGQPVVDLATGRVVAVETLIRWEHPLRGLLPPSDFLDAAEQGPLMLAIGQRTLRESCRMATAWCEQLGAEAPDLHVNVSGRQLESGSLTTDVMSTLATYCLPAGRLVLELTETHMPSLADSLLTDLSLLRDRGIRIAIDDLGTGYSSLSRLTELPVDILKIDMKFIAGLGRDPACQAVVRAVLSLGQEMGLSVIAEGVESPAQADLLAGYGCDTVQGYLYSAPRPERELLRYLLNTARPAPREVGTLRKPPIIVLPNPA